MELLREGRSCRDLDLLFFVFVSGALAAKLRAYYSWSVRSEITPDSVQEMPGIIHGPTACKTNTLPAVLSLLPRHWVSWVSCSTHLGRVKPTTGGGGTDLWVQVKTKSEKEG